MTRTPYIGYEIDRVMQFTHRVLAREHRRILVRGEHIPATKYGLTDPQTLARLLWEETLEATMLAYGPQAAADDGLLEPYEYVEPSHPPVSALTFLMLCDGIVGQLYSDGYDEKLAGHVLEALNLKARRYLPERDHVR